MRSLYGPGNRILIKRSLVGKEKLAEIRRLFFEGNGSKVIKWPADTWQAIPIRSGLTCP